MFSLRFYQCVARRVHWCDRCCQPIQPGETYEGVAEILPNQEHQVIRWRTHIDTNCDCPDEPDEKLFRRDGEGIASFFCKICMPAGEDGHLHLR